MLDLKICIRIALFLWVCRINGLDHAIEIIVDKGHRLGLSEIGEISVSYLTCLSTHAHLVVLSSFASFLLPSAITGWPGALATAVQNRVFRFKIRIQAIASTLDCWFQACDECSSGVTKDGDVFRCLKDLAPGGVLAQGTSLASWQPMGMQWLTWSCLETLLQT